MQARRIECPIQREILDDAMERLSAEPFGRVLTVELTPEEAAAFRGEKEGEFVSVLAVASVNGQPAFYGVDAPLKAGDIPANVAWKAMEAAAKCLSEKIKAEPLLAAPRGSA